MSFVSRAHCAIGAIACLALIAGSAMPAEAAAKAKPRKYIFDDLITPSMMAPLAPEPVRPQAKRREILLDQQRSGEAGWQDASRPAACSPLRPSPRTMWQSDAPGDVITVERSSRINEPFGLFTFRAPEGVLWRKWRSVQGRHRSRSARSRQLQARWRHLQRSGATLYVDGG